MSDSRPWVDEKYALMLDHYVDRFRVANRDPLLLNFRCPICGDSAKSKTKARAYVYRNKNGGCSFKCHNCGDSRSLGRLLKDAAPPLYTDYVLERYRGDDWTYDARTDRNRVSPPSEPKRQVPPGSLPRLADLPSDHPARLYWVSRKIPPSAMHRVYWTDNYYGWVNEHVVPKKFSDASVARGGGRIVFPFRNRDGAITGYTGRAVGGEDPKYVAIRAAADESTSAFGIDAVDTSRDAIVVEGPIDSLFLDNAVAMGSSSRKVPLAKKVMVFDNEPRNSEIVKIMRRAVDEGERVVVWPEGIEQKDVNDMVLAGLDPAQIIRENTYHGIRAKLAIDAWARS